MPSETKAYYTDLPYLPTDVIRPSATDEALWNTAYQTIVRNYGQERVMEVHVRWAFETICHECQDSLTTKDFIRKVRLTWLWKRPPLPRGVASF